MKNKRQIQKTIKKVQHERIYVIPGNAQHIGCRSNQEDSFGFSDLMIQKENSHDGILGVLADGMGGLEMGSEASSTAVSVMLEGFVSMAGEQSPPERMRSLLKLSNAAVVRLAKSFDLEGDVGSTLVAVLVQDGKLYWVSVGDSHIYLYRNRELKLLVKEHVYARKLEEEFEQGRITSEELLNHPDRNSLTSYLGLPLLEEIEQNTEPVLLQPGDRILLCSDGLYGTLTAHEIIKVLKSAKTPQKAAELLVKKAISKKAPYQDNTTVIILGCEKKLKYF